MEMILVILIITLLIGMGVFSLVGVMGDAESVAAKADVKNLETNLIRYRTVCDMFPTNAQGLQALVTRPSANPIPKQWKQFLQASAIKDPWNLPYQYKNPGARNKGGYDIYSLGPDGVESEDDIGNWE
jgi:general secretion pathway protein G